MKLIRNSCPSYSQTRCYWISVPVPLLQAQSHAGAHSNPVADALQSHYSKAVSSSIGGLGHGETAAIGRGYVNQSDFDGQGSGHDFNGGVSTYWRSNDLLHASLPRSSLVRCHGPDFLRARAVLAPCSRLRQQLGWRAGRVLQRLQVRLLSPAVRHSSSVSFA